MNRYSTTMGMLAKFPCPCCGHRVFDCGPGFHQACPICGWEDNLVQLRFVTMPGSCNRVSLEEAQRNYLDYGASERRSIGTTRDPVDGEEVEDGWRLLNLALDNVEEPQRGQNYGESYPYEDTTLLYYWRATYWRKLVS